MDMAVLQVCKQNQIKKSIHMQNQFTSLSQHHTYVFRIHMNFWFLIIYTTYSSEPLAIAMLKACIKLISQARSSTTITQFLVRNLEYTR